MGQNKQGHEMPDPNPVAIPVGFRKPESLNSIVRRLVRSEVSEAAEKHGLESFEEADDFDVEGEDPVDMQSPWDLDSDRDAVAQEAYERAAERGYAKGGEYRRVSDQEVSEWARRNGWRPPTSKPQKSGTKARKARKEPAGEQDADDAD